MNDPLTWAALIGTAGSIIAFVTFWMTIGSRISTAEAKADAANALAGAVLAKFEMRVTQTEEHRAKTGERIAALEAVVEATSKSLVAAELRLAKSIEDMGEKIDHLGDTIIKTLAELATKPPRK